VQTHAATLQAQRSNDLAATLLSLDRKSDKSVASTRPKILLGYSMGARAALLHAIANPTHWDALILISANPGIESAAERSARAASDTGLAQRIIRDGVPAFLEFWQQTPIIRSQQHIRADWRASMQQYRLQHTAAGLATSVERALPQTQWIKIPDAGHMPHLEAPEATATAIRRFVHQL
jgi:pimeloyl-ACP methyl ester carboxylesterase